MLLRSRRGPTNLEIEHHVSGHAHHRTWCDARMRARGIAGKSGQEDEDPLVAIDYGDLKFGGTEDDDDDDEVAQNTLFVLVAKDVNTGTFAAVSTTEKVCHVMDLVIAEQYCKVMESHQS